MNFFYKILLFSLLSFGFPIGKLFEIFIWNDRITKTEFVFHRQRIDSKRKFCLFVKISKYIKTKFSSNLLNKPDFALIGKITNKKNKQSISIQNHKASNIKPAIIRRNVFNILFIDDSVSDLSILL
jgi:hypothetical protein